MVPRNVQKQKGKHSYEIVPICEMNLVLRSAGERLGVMSGREGVYVGGVAMDFAKFLGVRLLDNSDRLPR